MFFKELFYQENHTIHLKKSLAPKPVGTEAGYKNWCAPEKSNLFNIHADVARKFMQEHILQTKRTGDTKDGRQKILISINEF